MLQGQVLPPCKIINISNVIILVVEYKWSKDYGDSVWKLLETYVFTAIGDKDVAEQDTGDLLVPVKKVEALGYLEFSNTLLRSSDMLLAAITPHMIWKVQLESTV